MQEQTVSFFQPDEFVRKRKRGKTFHLTPAVIFPATFPNAFVKIGELVVHGLIHRYSFAAVSVSRCPLDLQDGLTVSSIQSNLRGCKKRPVFPGLLLGERRAGRRRRSRLAARETDRFRSPDEYPKTTRRRSCFFPVPISGGSIDRRSHRNPQAREDGIQASLERRQFASGCPSQLTGGGAR